MCSALTYLLHFFWWDSSWFLVLHLVCCSEVALCWRKEGQRGLTQGSWALCIVSLLAALWGHLSVPSADLAVKELQGEDLVPKTMACLFSHSVMIFLPFNIRSLSCFTLYFSSDQKYQVGRVYILFLFMQLPSVLPVLSGSQICFFSPSESQAHIWLHSSLRKKCKTWNRLWLKSIFLACSANCRGLGGEGRRNRAEQGVSLESAPGFWLSYLRH